MAKVRCLEVAPHVKAKRIDLKNLRKVNMASSAASRDHSAFVKVGHLNQEALGTAGFLEQDCVWFAFVTPLATNLAMNDAESVNHKESVMLSRELVIFSRPTL